VFALHTLSLDPSIRAQFCGDENLQRVIDEKELRRDDAVRLLSYSGASARLLWTLAGTLRDQGKGRIVSYSRKVFIPLTNLCRDTCGYCTFKKDPWESGAMTVSPQQVITIAESGKRNGCTEALFTLGERPEQRYAEARDSLRKLGFSTTLEYLRHACELVIEKNGILPHANPGTMTKKEMDSLRSVNASMGLMLENVSERLCIPGGPHAQAPSKHPKLRLATIRNAGELKIAFTTGLLIGIGETLEEIVDSLLALKELHAEYGHIQEIIIQNFRAKQNTLMFANLEPAHEFMLNVVAVARLLFGKDMNIQVPPNLSSNSYVDFLSCGINDWGGISPVTKDYVNPEAPWPEVQTVNNLCAERGFRLKARLPIYPEFVLGRREFVPARIAALIDSLIDSEGYVFCSGMGN
jgi:FO synthase